MRRRLFLGTTAWMTGLCGLAHAQAQPVTVVVPFSAGSAQDISARMLTERLVQELRAPVVVVNKPGAGGTVGAAWVAQAKPDGLTYLLASSSHHLAGALHPRLSYHPLDSFRGAAFLGLSEYVLVTASSMKTPDLASFVVRVQAQPQAFNYASAGNGSVTHVGMAFFLDMAGLQMVHIPLKGTGEIIRELLAGRVQAAMVSAFSMKAYESDPRIDLLATTDSQPSSAFAQRPTLAQAGYPQFRWVSWTGLLAPRGTPEDKVQQVNRAVAHILQDPALLARFHESGISSKAMSASGFDELLHDDWIQSSSIMRRFKITLD